MYSHHLIVWTRNETSFFIDIINDALYYDSWEFLQLLVTQTKQKETKKLTRKSICKPFLVLYALSVGLFTLFRRHRDAPITRFDLVCYTASKVGNYSKYAKLTDIVILFGLNNIWTTTRMKHTHTELWRHSGLKGEQKSKNAFKCQTVGKFSQRFFVCFLSEKERAKGIKNNFTAPS